MGDQEYVPAPIPPTNGVYVGCRGATGFFCEPSQGDAKRRLTFAGRIDSRPGRGRYNVSDVVNVGDGRGEAMEAEPGQACEQSRERPPGERTASNDLR